jgi:hypothetical protein
MQGSTIRADDDSGWRELEPEEMFSAFVDLRLRNLLRYWLALRQEGRAPCRRDLDPSRFKDCLDMVWLLERHEDGRFRYRLAGQTIAEIHGGIRRGVDAATLFDPQALAMARRRWEGTLDGQITRAEGCVRLAGSHRFTRLERVILPLRGDDGSVSTLLGATVYENRRWRDQTVAEFQMTQALACRLDRIAPGASF